MKVLLLGASGFLGSWCARALTADGHSVEALCRPSSDTWRIDAVEGLTISRAPSEYWPTAIDRGEPEVVVSLDWAGVAANSREDSETQSRNLARHRSVIEASRRSDVRRFIGIGSQAEYGPATGSIAEDRPTQPTTAYGRAKSDALVALRDSSSESSMGWIWARVFSVYGPLEAPGWLLPSIADSAVAKSPMQLTSAWQAWSYLYAADAARAIVTLATHPNASGIYNVGSGVARPLRQSIEIFADMVGAAELLEFGARSGAPSSELRPDISRLRSLGWDELTALDDGLLLTADWLTGREVDDPFTRGTQLPFRPKTSFRPPN